MRILIILIPISLVLLGLAVWAFIWAVRRGQFDDLDTPAIDMLADEPRPLQRPAAAAPADRHAEDRPR
jgi:cbb3-type cytochrome oxidase maturation protein